MSNTSNKKFKPLYLLLLVLASFIALPFLLLPLFFLFYIFVAQPFQVNGSSMAPNFSDGEMYIGKKGLLNLSKLQRGDAIIFLLPHGKDGQQSLSRIIAVPGDTIAITNNMYILNGIPLEEDSYKADNVETVTGKFLKENEPVVVPDGKYFVSGDNRPFALDSRTYGFIAKEDIVSKIWFCYSNCSN